MLVHKVYWKVRDTLVQWGLVAAPRCALRRHPAGTVRNRLVGRGSARRMRRLTLPSLLRL